MMKHFFEESPPPSDSSKQASSSSSRESQTDQEMGPPINTTSKINGDHDAQVDDTTFWCFKGGRNINYARMVVAELVGTFILVFCVCGIVASTQLMRGEVGLLEYAITGGLTIIVVIFSVGPISGAHVNPSITIAFATLGQFPWSKVPFYILAQILGSVLATYVGKSVYGIQADLVTTQPLYGCKKAFWAELIATFIIMFLAAAMSNEAKAVGQVSGLVVGVAISLAVLITGPVSGGSLNPARSLGPAIVSWRFDSIWLYVLAPTIGAVAGALLFCVLRLRHPICSQFSSPNTGGLLVK